MDTENVYETGYPKEIHVRTVRQKYALNWTFQRYLSINIQRTSQKCQKVDTESKSKLSYLMDFESYPNKDIQWTWKTTKKVDIANYSANDYARPIYKQLLNLDLEWPFKKLTLIPGGGRILEGVTGGRSLN